MTLDLANSDKLNGFRQELGRLGIRLLPPDINASESIFSVEHDGPSGAGGIRYALAGVKTVGEPAARAVVDERRRGGPFTSLADFPAASTRIISTSGRSRTWRAPALSTRSTPTGGRCSTALRR